MFRFSIRELMLVTLVVAIGMAWVSEHMRLTAARADAIEARIEAREQKNLTIKATYEAERWKRGLIDLVRWQQAEEVDCDEVAIPVDQRLPSRAATIEADDPG